jgi:GNAT superfamily N-acetyltransferase
MNFFSGVGLVAQISFRPATPADSGKIAGLHTVSWRAAYRGILPDVYLDGPVAPEREALWRRRLCAAGAERRCVRLAEDGSTLAGFVCVLLDEEPAWGACLDNLHTAAAYRGRGIGRQLMSMASGWVMEKEPGWPIHLWVFAGNHEARRFYDALDGQIVERRAKGGPWGAEVLSLRYVWQDPQVLAKYRSPGGSLSL